MTDLDLATETPDAPTKRAKVINSAFVLPDTDTETAPTSKYASPDAIALTMEFIGAGELTATLLEVPQEIRDALAWHGLKQKLGDAAAGKAGNDAEEEAATVWERLQLGEWMKVREAGQARPSMVVDAVLAAMAKAGKVIDDAARERVAEKMKDKLVRKGALLNPKIAAEYEAIKMERAQAKAAKLAAAAADSNEEIDY